MAESTTPGSKSGGLAAMVPLWRELSSSFSGLGLQRRVEDDPDHSTSRSGRAPPRTPLAIPNTSLLDRNPQVSFISQYTHQFCP